MLTRRSLLLLCVLIGIVAVTGGPRAQGPVAAFHAIGNVPGGTTLIKDATRAGGVIYAVGGTLLRTPTTPPPSGCPAPCFKTDTAVLWRSDTGTLEALPDFVTNTSPLGLNGASAITPDARYIASQARLTVSPTGVVTLRAVRVDTSSLPSSAANLNLNTTFSPALTGATTALATSNDGTILYGVNPVPRAIRFDTSGATSLFIPLLGTDTQNSVATRGTSADGSVAVGSSFSTATNHKAYRYVYGSGVTAIPLLAGGTFNDALAVSPDGDLVLVTGNSTANPNGEAYLYRASTQAIQRLGSPNAPWSPGGRLCGAGCQPGTILAGGMTADGSVVAMNFNGAGDQYAYFHNAHGWFHLASALGANGIDLAADGWSMINLRIQGMSSDGTLVFGSGYHNGSVEGFVAEFGAGVLADFNPQAAAPASTSLVGAWTFVDPNDPFPTDPGHVVIFTADGAYYHIEGTGFERGYYTFDGSVLTITTVLDTNGSIGLSDSNGQIMGPITITEDTLIFEGAVEAYRIAGSPGTLVGGWVLGDPTQPDSSGVIAFTSSGKYFLAVDDQPNATGHDGIEIGQVTWDSTTGLLAPDLSQGVDTNGHWGLSDPAGGTITITANLTADALGLLVADGAGASLFARVIDPATIPVINSQLSASGSAGQAFSYFVTATNAVTFGAAGLPDGLSINSSTGEIGGTPSVGGQFDVTISATNAIGVSDIETLTLTIAGPTSPVIIWANPADITYGTPLGPSQLNATSSAPGTFDYSPPSGTLLQAGAAQPLTVTFTPTDANLYTVASATVYINVQTATQATLTVTGVPATGPYSSMFTVGTSGGSGTGAVTFSAIGSCTNSGGSAAITITISSGTCTITATKAADTNYELTTSAAASVVATKATQAPLTLVGALPPSAVFDTTFTPFPNGGSGTGGVTLSATGACTNTADGSAITMTSGTGTCSVTATKAGDANYQPMTSPPFSVTAIKASQPVLLVAGAPGTAVYGSSFTVSISGGSADATGEVSLTASGACRNADGGARIRMTAGFGECLVTATKAADLNYNATPSATVGVRATGKSASVTPPGPVIKVYGTPDPIDWSGTLEGFLPADNVAANYSRTAGEVVGQYTISATLTPASVLANYTISYGTAQFTIAPAQLTITAENQTRPYLTPNLPVTIVYSGFVNGDTEQSLAVQPTAFINATTYSLAGSYPIFFGLAYSPNYAITLVPGTLTITPVATAMALTSSRNPSSPGQWVTLTAAITFADAATECPADARGRFWCLPGSVTFKDGTTVLSTVPISQFNNGVVITEFMSWVSGPHALTAVYLGTTSLLGSTAALTQDVKGPVPTRVALTALPASPMVGQEVTFNAKVTIDPIVSGVTDAPDGWVVFYEGNKTLGSFYLLSSENGPAPLHVSTLSAGSHRITAEYQGNSRFAPAVSTEFYIEVVRIPTTTVLLPSDPNPTVYSEPITLTATVSSNVPDSATPTGTITFFSEPGGIFGTAAVVNGKATLRLLEVFPGSYEIKAQFNGAPEFLPSLSTSSQTHQVNPADVEIAIDRSKYSVKVGQQITFWATVTVKAPGTQNPGSFFGGWVEFRDYYSNEMLWIAGVYEKKYWGEATYVTVGGEYSGRPELSPGTHKMIAVFRPSSPVAYVSQTSTPIQWEVTAK